MMTNPDQSRNSAKRDPHWGIVMGITLVFGLFIILETVQLLFGENKQWLATLLPISFVGIATAIILWCFRRRISFPYSKWDKNVTRPALVNALIAGVEIVAIMFISGLMYFTLIVPIGNPLLAVVILVLAAGTWATLVIYLGIRYERR